MNEVVPKGVGFLDQQKEELQELVPAFLPVGLAYWIPFLFWVIVVCWPAKKDGFKRFCSGAELPLVLAMILGSGWVAAHGVSIAVERATGIGATDLEYEVLVLGVFSRAAEFGYVLAAIALGGTMLRRVLEASRRKS